jgi:hypothetical protein
VPNKKLIQSATLSILISSLSILAHAETIGVTDNQSIISDYPDENYGNNVWRGGLFVGRVYQDLSDFAFSRFYLKFDLPAYTSGSVITSATLTGLYNGPFDNGMYGNLRDVFSINQAQSNNWSSDTLTWANQPGYVADPVATFDNNYLTNSDSFLISWDITSAVQDRYTKDGVLSLVFKIQNESVNSPQNTWQYFSKKEAGLDQGFTITYTMATVPESSVPVMFALGFLGLFAGRKKYAR